MKQLWNWSHSDEAAVLVLIGLGLIFIGWFISKTIF